MLQRPIENMPKYETELVNEKIHCLSITLCIYQNNVQQVSVARKTCLKGCSTNWEIDLYIEIH